MRIAFRCFYYPECRLPNTRIRRRGFGVLLSRSKNRILLQHDGIWGPVGAKPFENETSLVRLFRLVSRALFLFFFPPPPLARLDFLLFEIGYAEGLIGWKYSFLNLIHPKDKIQLKFFDNYLLSVLLLNGSKRLRSSLCRHNWYFNLELDLNESLTLLVNHPRIVSRRPTLPSFFFLSNGIVFPIKKLCTLI